jgi:hypothetical protein
MVSTPRAGRVSKRAPDEARLAADLQAILVNGSALYLRLGPDGAILSVKLDEQTFAKGSSIGTDRWIDMTTEERARAVLGWIRKAANYCRDPRVRWVPA